MSPSRSTPAPTSPSASGSRALRSPSLIALTAAPTSSGIVTVITIASHAKTSDQITVRRYGRRNPNNRFRVAIALDYTK